MEKWARKEVLAKRLNFDQNKNRFFFIIYPLVVFGYDANCIKNLKLMSKVAKPLSLSKQTRRQCHEERVSLFLRKLRSILDEPSSVSHIIWEKQEEEGALRIIDTDLFENETIPRYFKHKKLKSFVRQLNLHGFRKVKLLGRSPRQAKEQIFVNKFFDRENPELHNMIKRKIFHSNEDEERSFLNRKLSQRIIKLQNIVDSHKDDKVLEYLEVVKHKSIQPYSRHIIELIKFFNLIPKEGSNLKDFSLESIEKKCKEEKKENNICHLYAHGLDFLTKLGCRTILQQSKQVDYNHDKEKDSRCESHEAAQQADWDDTTSTRSFSLPEGDIFYPYKST